ncbi:MAG: Gfo/Idh/MocA family oxidoreductase, partial [Clostridia bacterium]|nr:Gfo/Idh/MocA family oxidoreductase [Clostridia bacterium]
MEIKKLRAVLVGAGNRGCVYADYALQAPNELEIVGVVEPSDLRREQAATRYGVDQKNCFADLDVFLQAKID